jgi:hypothetical protein
MNANDDLHNDEVKKLKERLRVDEERIGQCERDLQDQRDELAKLKVAIENLESQ